MRFIIYFLSIKNIYATGISLLLQTAQSMRNLVRTKGGDNRLQLNILATVFYEASTRTSCSFQSAMLRLGGQVINVDAGKSGNSSAGKKGETLSDTIRCLQCYTNVIVLRHPTLGSVKEAILGSEKKPILNAGDGVGEHPTQALLDLFTIQDELGLLESSTFSFGANSFVPSDTNNLIIVLLGDLKHGRTVHSLAKLLARSGMKQSITIRYCSPASLEMPKYVMEYVSSYGLKQETFTDLEKAVQGANVLYVTRIQKERFEKIEDYNAVKVRSLSLFKYEF